MKKYLMTLAAAFCCAMTMAVFTACTDKIDNPAYPVDEPSAVDEGKWHVTEEIMNKSIRPGDDFFMYCNGGYWNSTVVDETNSFKRLFMGKLQDEMDKRVASLTLPSKVKTLADAEKTDAETIAAQKAKLQSAIDRVNALTTTEEAWQLLTDLYLEGYRTPLEPISFAMHGKVAILLNVHLSKDYVPQFWSENSLSWQLAHNPEVLARVHSLTSGGTRGIDTEKWPMVVTFFNALGVSLDDVYAIDDFPALILEGKAEESVATMSLLQNMSVEEWQDFLGSALQDDAVFFDEDAAAAVGTTCKEAVNNFIDLYNRYEVAAAFGKAYVTPDQKQRMTAFAEELRQTFRERIQNNVWMSAGSKKNATDKLDAMVFNVGAPDEWFEEGFADLSQEETLLDDILAMRRAKTKLLCTLTGKTVKEASFHQVILELPLTIVNSCYSHSGNYMNIYPAYMLYPTYDPQQNDAHNYAHMMAWGHEITHGFDTNGAKYNKLGDVGSIWATDADSQEFERRAKQLIDYYSTFDIMPFETGLKNDGAFTVSENVADLGGFYLAYDSYVKHLNKQGFKGEQLRLQLQRFYEAYSYLWCSKWNERQAITYTIGDESSGTSQNIQSLPRERINGIVSNTDDWYDLFGVMPGDKFYLAPENRIRIW